MIFILRNLLITMILIGAIEFFSSFFLNNSRYNQIYNVLKADVSLLWKVRGNLDQQFFKAQLSTNSGGFRKDNSKTVCQKRIGIFGASPSFGWGVDDDQTYTSRLNQLFEKRGWCFVNYSSIGYSSSQGIILLKDRVKKDKLDAVIVSYLVNDVDFNRFYFSGPLTDSEEMKKRSNFDFLREKLRDTNSYKLMMQLLVNGEKRSHADEAIVKTMAYERVPQDEFLENIESMLQFSQEKGIRFFYLEMPVGIQLMASYLREKCQTPEEVQDRLDRVKELISNCSLGEYKYLFMKDRSSLLNKVRSLVAMKRFENYRDLLRKRLNKDKIIRVRKIGLKDLEDFFLSKENDYVHPGPRGHQQIAVDISEFLNNEKLRL